MNARLFTALAACGFAFLQTSFAGEKDLIKRSFDVSPGSALYMKVDRGSIHISPSAGNTVEVAVTRELKRSSAEKAREAFQSHRVEMSQEGGGVRIVAESPSRLDKIFNRMNVEYDIRVPKRFNLDLHTSGGTIEVGELEGEIKSSTSGGNIKLGDITGPVEAQTSGGNIILSASKGPANLRTSGGDVRAGAVDGDVIAKTSGGSITLDQVKGSTDARTSGGNIHLRDAMGTVSAQTSGGSISALISQQPKSNCTLKTSGGNVEVALAENLALTLDAHTSGGRVHSDFAGESNKSQTKLAARLNGGGPDLLLATSGGNVTIRKH